MQAGMEVVRRSSMAHGCWVGGGVTQLCHTPGITRRHAIGRFSTLLSFYEGNAPITDGFPSQRASNGELNVLFAFSLCLSCFTNGPVAQTWVAMALT